MQQKLMSIKRFVIISSKFKYLATILCSLVAVQCIFYFIQSSHTQNIERSLTGLLRNEINMSEPYRLSQSIVDLESIGLFRCSILKNNTQNRIYQDLRFKLKTSECRPSFFHLNGKEINRTIMSINGEQWQLSLISENPASFYSMLWLFRVLAASTALLFHLYLNSEIAKANLEKEHHKQYFELAEQVAHDIRSPLLALNSVASEFGQIDPESKSVLEEALQRINAISNELLNENRNAILETSIDEVLQAITREKKAEFKGRPEIKVRYLSNIGSRAYASIHKESFRRVISNLINNSIEAMPKGGAVELRLDLSTNEIHIHIKDSGPGISPTLIKKIGARGFSTKCSGSGLGLSYAMKQVSAWSGSLKIISDVNEGTDIHITLPLVKREDTNAIVLVDNDPVIQKLWLKAAKKYNKSLRCFSSSSQIESALASIQKSTAIYIDVNLDASECGIELAKKLNRQGYVELFLASGYSSSYFKREDLSNFKASTGKTPPWIS